MKKIYDVEFCNEIENSFMNNGIVIEVEHITQYDVKERIRYLTEDFCMLTTESTEDSCFDVEPNESKFLNDDNYRDDSGNQRRTTVIEEIIQRIIHIHGYVPSDKLYRCENKIGIVH